MGLGMRPWPHSIPRVIAWSFAYLIAASATNAAFHTNFGYLRSKPVQPSLLDFLGPWPVYVAVLVGLGLIYVLLLYSPFLLADGLGRKRSPGRS